MIRKGATNLNICFVAVFAFILTWIGEPLLSGLLIGYAVLVEKDNWLIDQTVQAFFLGFVVSAVSLVLRGALYPFTLIPYIGAAFSMLFDIIISILRILVLVFIIISAVNVSKGKDANVPVISKLSKWGIGFVQKRG
ncbi:MAG: hypothetical protein LBR77_10270 [Lachnospiraceae bacterium]|nr:hypothetical protein [Lachnospiraceae bacterium]